MKKIILTIGMITITLLIPTVIVEAAFTANQVQGVFGEFQPVLDRAGGSFTQNQIQGVLGEFKPVLDSAQVTGGIAELTGTAVPTITEADVVAGGKTIIITLTDDTWVATVGEDNAITTALINGIDSAQSEGTGWDAVVKANMVYTDVARTSDTVVTVTLGDEATYDITATETITVTIPATAVTLATEIVATPTFTVTAVVVGRRIIIIQ